MLSLHLPCASFVVENNTLGHNKSDQQNTQTSVQKYATQAKIYPSCCAVYHCKKILLTLVRFRPVLLAAEPVTGQDEVVHALCIDVDRSVVDSSVDASSSKTITLALASAGHIALVAFVWSMASTATVVIPASVPWR